MSPEKPKKKPTVKEGLQDQTIVEESTVTFEAEIEGEPKPTYKWYLNETQLEESEVNIFQNFFLIFRIVSKKQILEYFLLFFCEVRQFRPL